MARKKKDKVEKEIERNKKYLLQRWTYENREMIWQLIRELVYVQCNRELNSDEASLRWINAIKEKYDSYMQGLYAGVANHYTELMVGEPYDNYKVLCSILCEEEKDGEAKKRQLENWSNYFSWVQNKQRFIITEIKDNPAPRIDKRSEGNNGKYLPTINNILLDFLANREGYSYSATLNQWMLTLGMVNDLFSGITIKKLQELEPGIREWELNKHTSVIKNQFHAIIKSTFRSLEKKKVIRVEINDIICDASNNYRPATDEEKAKLLQAEGYALDKVKEEYGLLNNINTEDWSMQNIIRNGLWQLYLDERNDYILNNYNWKYYFQQWKVIYNQKRAKKYLNSISICEERQKLNNIMFEKASSLPIKIIEKQRKKIEEKLNQMGYGIDEIDQFTYGELNSMGVFYYGSDFKKNFDLMNNIRIPIDTSYTGCNAEVYESEVYYDYLEGYDHADIDDIM